MTGGSSHCCCLYRCTAGRASVFPSAFPSQHLDCLQKISRYQWDSLLCFWVRSAKEYILCMWLRSNWNRNPMNDSHNPRERSLLNTGYFIVKGLRFPAPLENTIVTVIFFHLLFFYVLIMSAKTYYDMTGKQSYFVYTLLLKGTLREGTILLIFVVPALLIRLTVPLMPSYWIELVNSISC